MFLCKGDGVVKKKNLIWCYAKKCYAELWNLAIDIRIEVRKGEMYGTG